MYQNWVGGTRPGNALFVPPPPDQVLECLGALEKFLHDDPVKTALLIKAALAHVQFETIHPFLDGNGKTVVTCHLVGNFPGSPVDLRFLFTLEGEKIASLEVIPYWSSLRHDPAFQSLTS